LRRPERPEQPGSIHLFAQHARRGSQSVIWMKPVVARLSAEDILNIAAYTASLPLPGK
jgi:cytochrome c553